MRVGVGLPTSVPGIDGRTILAWARRAEQGPFTSLGVVDRVAWDAHDPFVSLAAAAAVTSRLALVTMVAIGPLRASAVLAKQAASVHALSGGRLVLGLAVGARTEDYDAAGMPHAARGERFSAQLPALRDWFEDGGIAPATEGGPLILVGGTGDVGLVRVARFADGYVHGGGPPRAFARTADKVRAVWRDAGRPGRPRFWAQGYFALGADAAERGLAYMRAYYAFTGPFADRIAAGLLTSPQAVSQFLRGYREAGCEEMVLLPAVPDLDQLDRLEQVLAALPDWGTA